MRPSQGWSRLIRVAPVLFAAGICFPGCRATPGNQGRERAITATYYLGTLVADLPESVRVPAVIAAARAALAGRGYSAVPETTHRSGRVVGAAPVSGILDKVTVSAREIPGATRVEVKIDPFGDQTESRAILDAVLVLLGM